MATTRIVGPFTNDTVEASDATEMQDKLRALLTSLGATRYVADVDLAGVGVGPRWLCHLTVTTDINAGVLATGSETAGSAFVVTESDEVALEEKINALFIANPGLDYIALRTAGAGAGRDYMAVLVLATPAG